MKNAEKDQITNENIFALTALREQPEAIATDKFSLRISFMFTKKFLNVLEKYNYKMKFEVKTEG